MITAVLIVLIDYIALLYSYTRDNFSKIQGFIVSRLVYMGIINALLLNLFGYVINIGTILYSSVMIAQCLIMKRWGLEVVNRILKTTVSIMFLIAILSLTITNLPILQGNELYGNAVMILLNFVPRNVFASFFAYIISQLVLVRLWFKLKYNFVLKSFIAITIAQVIDSLIFFPIAFININFVPLMITGFITKVCLTIMFLPLLYIVNKYEK